MNYLIPQVKYEREFCCPDCGLIFFNITDLINDTECPECGNSTRKRGLYVCDSAGYIYAYYGIVNDLRSRGKDIHYAENHPLYKKI